MNRVLKRVYLWLDFFVQKPITRAGSHLCFANGGMGDFGHIFHAHPLF